MDFHPMSVVLVLNCELLGGCLGSESRNDLPSASKAIGDGPCVSIEGQPFPFTAMGDRGAAGGYSGQQSMPNSGPRFRGWRSMRSKCPPSRSFHCRVLLSCFVVGGGLDLTLTISLAFHITSH